jgi:hypothetical protein
MAADVGAVDVAITNSGEHFSAKTVIVKIPLICKLLLNCIVCDKPY